MSWNENNIKILKEYWQKGKSAKQIAEMIGNVTRNAVIGRLAPLIYQRGTGLKEKQIDLIFRQKLKEELLLLIKILKIPQIKKVHNLKKLEKVNLNH